MKLYPDRCILLNNPGKDHTKWYTEISEKYTIKPYIQIDSPVKFISQVRYQTRDTEIVLVINSNMNASYEITITPSTELIAGKKCWLWNPETGERNQMISTANRIALTMGPADLKLLIFDKQKKGPHYQRTRPNNATTLSSLWSVTGQHIDGTLLRTEMEVLKDLKDIPEWINFCGVITYKTTLVADTSKKIEWLDLGKLFGVSELFINGQNAGVRWYGTRIYNIAGLLKNGQNTIEAMLTTTMGNYLKSLKDNRVAQYWTNEGRTIQPVQSFGLMGPVIAY